MSPRSRLPDRVTSALIAPVSEPAPTRDRARRGASHHPDGRVSGTLAPAPPIVGENVAVASGKRAAPRPPRQQRGRLLPWAAGMTLALVAWGYLVLAAIDFGATARGGDGRSWGFLALAAVGAIACLFLALLMLTRLIRALATPTSTPAGSPSATTATARPGSPAGSATTAGDEPPTAPPGRRAAR